MSADSGPAGVPKSEGAVVTPNGVANTSPAPNGAATSNPAPDIEPAPRHIFHHERHTAFGKETQDAFYRFNNPEQIWKRRHRLIVKWLGRVGWVAKGVIYAIIGGLSCQAAVSGSAPSTTSPQGAFILLGDNPAGTPLLVVLAVGILLYVIWRFWEAFTGQGTDQTYSKLKNFFKFRLSPFVSGSVYTAYMAYIIYLITQTQENRQKGNTGDFTNKWNKYAWGKFLLAVLGLAFTAATLVQLDCTFRKAWHRDYRLDDIDHRIKWATLITGHVGYAGRAGVFLFVAVLFFRSITREVGDNKTTIGDALLQLESSGGGRFLLFLLGLALIVYGGFAALSSYSRYFPTQPPSRLARTHTLSPSRVLQRQAEEEQARLAKERRAARKAVMPEALPGAVPGVVPVYGPGVVALNVSGPPPIRDIETGPV